MKFAPQVRFLTDQELDSAARELLHKFAKSRGQPIVPPIPVDAIIEKYLRITLEVRDLTAIVGENVLGAAWFEENIIRVDESLERQEGRLSFTMAHEVGHWVLHRPQYEATKVTGQLFKRKPDEVPPAIVCRSSQRKERAEWQADQFAARVLMPDKFVRAAYRHVAGEEPLLFDDATEMTRIGSTREVAALVLTSGNFSNVSREAMSIRLKTLKLVVPASHVSVRLV